MDSILAKRLNDLNDQNKILEKVEREFLFLEANSKVLFAQLFLKSEGSDSESRKSAVHSSQEWIDFISGFVDMESSRNKEKRRFEILMNAFIAELNTFKREGSLIDKGGYQT